MWEDEERTRDVSNIVKTLIPPVGMRTSYYPGQEGFLSQDLTQPAGTGGPVPRTAVDIGNMGTPAPTGVSTSNAPSGRIDLAGSSYYMPQVAINEAVNAGTGGGTSMGAPKYGIPDEMMTRFDDAIKAITGPSDTTDLIKMQAQGYGLGLGGRRIPGGGYEPNPRLAASSALAHIEGVKRQAISHVATAISNLMMDPNKFAQEIYGTQMRSASEQERNRLLGRRTAVDETLLPYQIREKMMEAPKTVAGVGPGGESILYGWDPNKQDWTTISKGAVPVGLHVDERLVNRVTGEEIGRGGEGRRNQERLAAISWKAYEDEMKAIEKDTTLQDTDEPTVKAKQARQAQAWSRLSDSMTRLGYGDMFKAGAGATGSWGQSEAPKEGQIYQGQNGKYVFKNGKWEIYNGR